MAPARSSARTPRKGITSGSGKGKSKITKTTASRKIGSSSSAIRPKGNSSILDYFKKVADEDLFMGEAATVNAGDDEDDKDEDGGDNNDVDETSTPGGNVVDGEASLAPSRANKIAAAGREGVGAGEAADDKENRFGFGHGKRVAGAGAEAEAEANKLPAAQVTKPAVAAAAAAAAKKRVRGNPFLDDSDEEEDETVRTIPDTVMTLEGADDEEVLTREESSDRGEEWVVRPALLREETSGDVGEGNRALLQGKEEEDNDFEGGNGDGFELDGEQDLELFREGGWGEEFREMKYMREQARLEAEEAGFAGQQEESGLIEERCPICNDSLAGVTEDQATAHVNACLDGDPTPLPLPKPPDTSNSSPSPISLDAAEVGKRFAKAAVPRPGQANPFRLGGDFEGQASSAFAKLMNGHAEDAAWATAAASENASRGMPAYKRTCPFYKIMPGFSICVDAFRYGAVEGCNAYFLSHFHSDHYIGLTANWTHGPIYCSKVTASLVKSQLRTAEKFVVELEFDKKVPVPGTDGVTVTMIPANHCPGSSLFLFEKLVGGRRIHRILHCGDFRACPAHVSHPELRPETVHAISGKTNQQKIDVCYLDTTYLNPRYSFPPQDDVIRSCAELCVALDKGIAEDDDSVWNALLRRRDGGAPPSLDSVSKFFKSEKASAIEPVPTPDGALNGVPDAFTALRDGPPDRKRLLIVCGTYSIGKERICKAIAQALDTKIFASPQKIRICRQLDDPELSALLTSDPREAQVHMQMLMEIRADTLAEYLELHNRHFSRIIGFRPSGWNFRPSGTNANANVAPSSVPSHQLLHGPGWRTRLRVKDLVPQRGSGKEAMCFGVPYSEHSSFRELAMFLMALRIEKVVPTVNVGSEQSRKRMKGWTDRWLAERRRGGLVRILERDETGEERSGGKALWDGKSGKGGHVYW